MTASNTSPRRPLVSRAVLAGAVVVAVLLAFGIGHLTGGDEGPAHRSGPADAGLDRQATQPWSAQPSAPRAAAPAQGALAMEAPPVALPLPPPQSPQELVTRVTQEVEAQLLAQRPELTAQCFPSSGLPGGRSSAQLTFNVMFDARGREIARGISEDRKAPAGALATCLRRLPLGSLKIQPPGSSVGVKVSMVFP